MSKITSFINWLTAQVGHIYVWGGQGETDFDETWIRGMENSKNNADRAINLYRQRKKEGRNPIAAYDCSGLIVKYLLDNGLIGSDTTAAGLHTKCCPLNRSDIKAGDFVFRDNGTKIYHVGVYIGDNTVIHSMGRDVGVVKESLNANGTSYWNRFGRYEKLQDKEETEMAKVIKKTSPLMRGDDVKKLQEALNALGYICGTADGVAGDKTIAAIEKFAVAHGVGMPESVMVNVTVGDKTYKGKAKS